MARTYFPVSVQLLRLLLALIAILPGGPLAAQRLHGHAISVVDGDTFVLLTPEGNRLRIRMTEIDTPEAQQPHARQSRDLLRALILRQPVSIEMRGTDRYGRILGRVRRGTLDVNGEMVIRGAAWANLPYLTDQRFLTWEREALVARRGIWALPASQRVPPWDQRRLAAPAARRALPPAPVPQKSGAISGRCGTKTRCNQMASCAEATFFLRQCGVRSLDRDGDGKPCEALCGP
jgi:endonuclease YncB( thermonuclease family)